MTTIPSRAHFVSLGADARSRALLELDMNARPGPRPQAAPSAALRLDVRQRASAPEAGS